MTADHRIHVFGASGSGTTTLGKALSRELSCAHFDADDFFWLPTDPPYQEKTPKPQRIQAISSTLGPTGAWVLSGCIAGWGDWIKPRLSVAVFVRLPPTTRLRRLQAREKQEFGNRIEPEGDLHHSHLKFIQWAASYDTAEPPIRSLKLHQQWVASLSCPVVEVDSTNSVGLLCKQVMESTT